MYKNKVKVNRILRIQNLVEKKVQLLHIILYPDNKFFKTKKYASNLFVLLLNKRIGRNSQRKRITKRYFQKIQLKIFIIYNQFYYKKCMRYIIKGGVWKNSEDQILKAAIMKYGLNQWSRISSLLQRKSAKQCKQRWYEWLDPSIKKTQWSRAQDEKLLQLARVFPSQWRTIAPFVGRTPTQCFQRYQKLLDLAQGKTNNESEDLKKLRPGQIDPNPETKPARLDPIDMDEDQKQMLAEVRVRLANTKGKKAKRKERQKIIEEARRLAQLQKIRQLEMAGVDNIPTAKEIKRMRQKKDIDYNKQVPFKREIPEFTYKVQESQTHKNTFFASTISLQTLEGKRRDVEEELQRKLDKKRLKKLKDRDLKQVLKFKNDFDKPAAFPVQLPQPQLNDQDIENMRKYNITTPLNSQLLNSQTPFGMTPENKIMFSARINLSLNHQELMTPGEQPEVKEEVDGVQGLNYLRQMDKMQKDPNRMRSVDRLISERIKTPSSSVHEWQQEKGQIKSLFKKLKKPEQQIEFQIPQEEEEEEDEVIMDAEELEKIQLERQRIEEEQRLNQRSETLKRNLPRPKIIPGQLKPKNKNAVQELIEKQMISMLYSDALDYPEGNVKLPQTTIPYIQPINQQTMEQSKKLVEEEMNKIEEKEKQKIQKAYQKEKDHLFFNTKVQEYQYRQQRKEQKQIIENSRESEGLYREYAKKVDHNEKKVKKYLGGYEKLIQKKVNEINALENELAKIKMEKSSLKVLRNHEKVSMSNRLSELQAFYKLVYNSI